MNNRTIVALGRMACGTAIIITSIVTGVNGTFISLGILLLGLPVEALQHDKKEEEG